MFSRVIELPAQCVFPREGERLWRRARESRMGEARAADNRIFLPRLPEGIAREDVLKTHFQRFGNITDCYLVRTPQRERAHVTACFPAAVLGGRGS